MTIIIQQRNIFDKILGLLGKKRGFILPKENPYQKWGPYTTYVIPRENFFRALFGLNKHSSGKILYDIEEIEERFGAIDRKNCTTNKCSERKKPRR